VLRGRQSSAALYTVGYNAVDVSTGGYRMDEGKYGEIKGPYLQRSIKQRIEAFFLDNIGKIVTREQIIEVARDPQTGREPENWHQRLSELRTDDGYTILSWRNRGDLKISEYLMPTPEKRPKVGRRVQIRPPTWQQVLQRANYRCEWSEGASYVA
jgi:hypothetical protein